MDFQKDWMKTSELVAIGMPRNLLKNIPKVPGQRIAVKTTESVKGGTYIYYTPELKKYLENSIKREQRRLEII